MDSESYSKYIFWLTSEITPENNVFKGHIEAHRRCVYSRVYYALFHKFQNFAEKYFNYQIPGENENDGMGTHAHLQKCLNENPVPKHIKSKFQQMKRTRTHADYKKEPFTITVETALADFNRISDALESIFPSK
jgi:hypothetical protein